MSKQQLKGHKEGKRQNDSQRGTRKVNVKTITKGGTRKVNVKTITKGAQKEGGQLNFNRGDKYLDYKYNQKE